MYVCIYFSRKKAGILKLSSSNMALVRLYQSKPLFSSSLLCICPAIRWRCLMDAGANESKVMPGIKATGGDRHTTSKGSAEDTVVSSGTKRKRTRCLPLRAASLLHAFVHDSLILTTSLAGAVTGTGLALTVSDWGRCGTCEACTRPVNCGQAPLPLCSLPQFRCLPQPRCSTAPRLLRCTSINMQLLDYTYTTTLALLQFLHLTCSFSSFGT